MANGRFRKNTPRQLRALTSTPPTMGPLAAPIPAMAPHSPSARDRARGSGYATWSSNSDDGTSTAARALDGPRRNQHAERWRQAAGRRRRAEGHQPGGEHPPPAQPLGERAAGDQQGGEGQGVGVHHLLQPGDPAVQAAPDGRQRHIGHRRVQDDHEVAGTDQGQRGRWRARPRTRPWCRGCLHASSITHQYFAEERTVVAERLPSPSLSLVYPDPLLVFSRETAGLAPGMSRFVEPFRVTRRI